MRPEDETFIRETVGEWMKDSGQQPKIPSFIEYENFGINELNFRLALANETIRNANKRIEELKTSGYVNPDFAVLGLDPRTAFVGLTEDQIQEVIASAKRTRARFNHPDTGGSTEKMQRINAAADALKHVSTRGNHKR